MATLDQPLILDQSVQVVVLASGKTPFEVEEPLEVPAGRNLTIVGNSSRNGDTRVKVNMTEDLKVNGALQLERLSVFMPDSNVDAPLVEVLDGGVAEIIQTELRVNVGEVALAVHNGSLVLREVIIAGELPASMAVTLTLVVSSVNVGDFTDAADRAGLIQAIASLADVPPAAVALTLEAASVRLTFHICTSGSAATEARLKKLLPNATEAFAKLGVSAEAGTGHPHRRRRLSLLAGRHRAAASSTAALAAALSHCSLLTLVST